MNPIPPPNPSSRERYLQKKSITDWHSPASLQDLMNTAKDFHPVVQKIFKLVPGILTSLAYPNICTTDKK
jgi:hypothetical protein